MNEVPLQGLGSRTNQGALVVRQGSRVQGPGSRVQGPGSRTNQGALGDDAVDGDELVDQPR